MSVNSKLILYVDDHKDSAGLMSTWLNLEGHEVKTASSCAEALAFVQSNNVKLMILDAHLPDGNGFDLCQILLAKSSTTQVIIVSGDTRPEMQKQAKAAGAKAFVGKPINLDEMTLLITQLVNAEEG